MIIIKKMFWIYTLPFLFLIGYIFVAFIFKVIKEVINKEVSLEDFTKEVDVRYARCDTVYNSLEKLNNYHKIVLLTNDTMLFMNEYSISLITVKNYIGTLKGNEDDKILTIKSEEELEVENPKILLNKVYDKIKEKIPNYEVKKYLILGAVCITNLKYKDIKILRMNNYYYYINKLGKQKIYTKEIIDKVFEDLKW